LEDAKKKIKNGEKYVIRFDVTETGETEFEDVIRGKVKFSNKNLDDFVILKSDGYPTYHLAHVVDDHLMKTSLVFRGEEWLPSAPKHILMFEAFGWEKPGYAHLNVILNKNTSRKLSKRDGDVSVEDFRKYGYLPEAVINFIVLLGWNPKTEQEMFTLGELIEQFDEKKLNKAGAIFDIEKLDWMNGNYIRKKDTDKLADLCRGYIENYIESLEKKPDKNLLNAGYYRKIVAVEKERLRKLSDITDNIDFYFFSPNCPKDLLKWKNMDDSETGKSLEKSKEILGEIEEKEWNLENIKEKLLSAADPKNRGELLWPLRVALTGAEKSPSPFEAAWAIGRGESLKRVREAISLIMS